MRKLTSADFWDRVERGPGCWLYSAGVGIGHMGYGRFGSVLAHRYAWSLEKGPVPEGMIVMHSCDTPRCVRLDHLRLGTVAENQTDMQRKGRSGWKQRTHCKKGHPFTPENTLYERGMRLCYTCRRGKWIPPERRYRKQIV